MTGGTKERERRRISKLTALKVILNHEALVLGTMVSQGELTSGIVTRMGKLPADVETQKLNRKSATPRAVWNT